MKEQLVLQLKTQIMDLERFINFLQGDQTETVATKQIPSKNECTCRVHSEKKGYTSAERLVHHDRRKKEENSDESIKKTMNMVRRVATLLQLFTLSQFGCGPSSRFNSLKKTMKINHWGDLRARLELAVVNVLTLVSDRDSHIAYDDYSSDSESVSATWSVKVTRAVRKQLAVSIRDLMSHGLVAVDSGTSIVPFLGCFPPKSAHQVPSMHPWELILQYYEMKNGARFNATPFRKLSESFNLNMIGSTSISHKQFMLSAIGHILAVHTKFKRSYDAQFKAFICTALNSKRLVIWLRLVFRCESLVETYYEPWSYACRTGFEDSLQSLDKLSRLDFDLPVDTAVQHFQNIRDAF